MVKTALLKCSAYSLEELKQIIMQGIDSIGWDTSVFRDARVALKPNLLMGASVERAIVTHPVFFQAVVQIIKHYGGFPVLIESPAVAALEKVMKKVGYTEIAEQEGVEVPDVKPVAVLQYANALTYKRLEISQALFEVDVIVNLPKFKTHGITYITGAVKNLFGAIPGLNKSQMHMKAPTPESFADFLLDLYGAFCYGFEPPKPMLHIMDAVIGQEGEGPGPAGTPRHIGAVIISDNAIAVDFAATQVVRLDVQHVRTITSGFERLYGLSSPDDIKIIGENYDSFGISGFKATKRGIFSNVMRGPIISTSFKNLFTEKPVPDPKQCTLCYQCQVICPAKAIERAAKGKTIPAYNYDACIRCFCCLEICPEAAISIKRGRFQWMLKAG